MQGSARSGPQVIVLLAIAAIFRVLEDYLVAEPEATIFTVASAQAWAS